MADWEASMKIHLVLPAVWQILVIRWCMVDLVNVFGLAPAKARPPWTASHDGWLFVCSMNKSFASSRSGQEWFPPVKRFW